MGVGDVEVGVELGSAGDNSRGLLGMTRRWFDGRQSLGRTVLHYGAEVQDVRPPPPDLFPSPPRWLGCNVGSGASEAITTNPNPSLSRI
jgi:hypothetical protein